MRVDVLINSRAGYADGELVKQKVRESLFRCDLRFHAPTSVFAMQALIDEVATEGCDALIVCGGDGTINTCLPPLMSRVQAGLKIPPLAVIPMGTANDLAAELGISKRVEKAARGVLEGTPKIVDVLEVESQGKKAYMLTNGGLGIPAQTARQANVVRSWVKSKAAKKSDGALSNLFFGYVRDFIELAGSKIYEGLLLKEYGDWDSELWEVSLSIPGKTSFRTRAPFIMINNQPSLGGSFTPAPYTSNVDGTFNVLLISSESKLSELKAILDIRFGKLPKLGVCPSFETSEIKIRASEDTNLLTFFGDGEILFENVRELNIRCVHPGISVFGRAVVP